jgi:hypothetical protein
MLTALKKSTKQITHFNAAKLRNRLAKIQASWQSNDREERAILAQARQLQLCKLAGILG